jgi:NADPH:quinone reductase-like Zn-dependent oxidoreductase
MFAVQMANAAGAEVTAVCSTRNLDLARSWGADQVIDYTREDFTKSGRQYDLILGVNGYHPLRAYRRALKPQGVYVCAGGELSQLFQAILFGKWFSQKGGRRLGSMGVAKFNPADLEHLGELLKDGALAPSIDRQFPLEETVNAIRYVIDHHAQGKIVLTMG